MFLRNPYTAIALTVTVKTSNVEKTFFQHTGVGMASVQKGCEKVSGYQSLQTSEWPSVGGRFCVAYRIPPRGWRRQESIPASTERERSNPDA